MFVQVCAEEGHPLSDDVSVRGHVRGFVVPGGFALAGCGGHTAQG